MNKMAKCDTFLACLVRYGFTVSVNGFGRIFVKTSYGVTANLCFHPDSVEISRMFVFRKDRNRGFGGVALMRICAAADKANMRLYLYAGNLLIESPKDACWRLAAWYARVGGFSPVKLITMHRIPYVYMVRKP